jgi:hypothetical protein
MSVYVGIDVHRKRSQVAVVDQAGQVLANRNVPNGIETVGVAGRAARRLWVRAASGASVAVQGRRHR